LAIYDAFISYSHSKDKPIASALQSVIQRLGRPWHQRRALRVFRDDTSLSATPQLWPSIEAALAQSRFLILMASPEAAASPWVGKEIAFWLAHKGMDTLLIALTDGQLVWNGGSVDFAWSEATPLPGVLRDKFVAEPKWVDLSAHRAGASARDPKFMELAADFAAAVLGVPKVDLLSEEVRQQRRALTLAWSGNSGALKEGLEAAEDARAIMEGLAARAPGNSGSQLDLAESYVPLGDLLLDAGRRQEALDNYRKEEALAAYRKSLAIRQKLAAADPGNTDAQYDLAWSHGLVAKAQVRLGRADEALASFHAALAIGEKLAASDSGNMEWQRSLSPISIAWPACSRPSIGSMKRWKPTAGMPPLRNGSRLPIPETPSCSTISGPATT
jgi:hypothetical protein